LVVALLSVGSAPLAAPAASKESSRDAASTWETERAVEIRPLGYGAKLLVEKGAQFRIERPTELVLGASNAKTTAYVVRVVSGRVDVDVPEANPPRVAVMMRGPGQLAAIFKGGKGAVFATASRLTAVSFSGEALAGSGSAWQRVPAQSMRHFGVGTPSRAAPLLPAPEAASGTTLAVALGGAPAKARLQWPAVSGAKSYDVLVTSRADGRILARHAVERPELALDLPAGSYRVETRARDIAGIEGAG